MAFFQTLMASPHIAQMPVFKVSLAQHQSKNSPHLPVVHRSHVQKHITSKTETPQAFPNQSFQSAAIIVSEPVKINTLKLYNPPIFCQLNTDVLKRYRLHRTFLI